MTTSIDNASGALPGVVRDAVTGVTWSINSSGVPAITQTGSTSAVVGSVSIDNSKTTLPGIIRDAITGRALVVNADGSINVVVR